MTQSRVAWFTGLSGAGKSTVAQQAAELLMRRGLKVLVLDGDAMRSTVHAHLGFSPEDIRENNRLIAHHSKDCLTQYDIILVPIISPFRDSRQAAKEILGDSFVEVYVYASLDEAKRRDPKGLYRRAELGELQGMIGVAEQVPYEPPQSADLVLDTENYGAEACASQLAAFLMNSEDYQMPK